MSALTILRAASRDVANERYVEVMEAIDALDEAVEALKLIERRAKPHPDETDADRKRNLYFCESIARVTLARCGELK